jgi:hypothetical protein
MLAEAAPAGAHLDPSVAPPYDGVLAGLAIWQRK